MPEEPAPTMPRWGDAALTALLCLPYAVSSFALPWGRDQGIYAHAAGRMLDGYVPYTETFVFKPPGTLVVHALAELLFGRGMLAIRLLDVGWTVATALLLSIIAVRATGQRSAGVVAGVTYAVVYHQQSYWMSAQTDAWANLPVALGVVVLLLARSPRSALLAGVVAGAMAGLAFWLKYPNGGVLPVMLVLPLLMFGRRGVGAMLTMLVGFAAAAGVVLGSLYAAGALQEFVATQTEVVLPYTGATRDGLGRRDWYRYFVPMGRFTPPGLILGALGLVMVVVDLWRQRRLDSRAIAGIAAVGWTFAGLLSALVQGKYWTYQYLLVLGGLAVLVAIGVSAVTRWVPRRWVLGGAVLTLLIVSGFYFPGRWVGLAQAVGGKPMREVWLEGQNGGRGYSYEEIVAVSDWVGDHTPADEPIFVWGYDPVIYVLAEREMVSRFPYTYPMVVGWGPADDYKAELMVALHSAPPSAVVIGARDGLPQVMGHRKSSRRTLVEFGALRDFLREGYGSAERVGQFRVYLRDDLDQR